MPEAATGEAVMPSPTVRDARPAGPLPAGWPPGPPPPPVAAPEPPPPEPPPPVAPPTGAEVAPGRSRPSRFAMWTAAVALVALVVGILVGIASTGPQRTELARQRDRLSLLRNDRRAEQDRRQRDVDELEANVADRQAQLDEASSAGAAAAATRETCSKASTDASDLLLQYDNYLSDLADLSYAAAGSTEERQLRDHLRTQDGIIASQQQIAAKQLADCQAAVGR